MERCELCGASFAPSDHLEEVVSARILCPKCAAERRARKAGKHGPAVAVSAGKAASAPAPEETAELEAVDELEPVPAAGPVHDGSAPRALLRSKGRRESEAEEVGEDEDPHERAARIHGEIRHRQQVTMRIAYSVITVSALVLGLLLWVHFSRAAELAAAEKTRTDRLQAFQAATENLDVRKAADAEKFLRLAPEHKAAWQGEAVLAADVISRMQAAQATVEFAKEQSVHLKTVADTEALLADPKAVNPDSALRLHERLAAATAAMAGRDPELAKRVQTVHAQLAEVLGASLVADARQMAQNGSADPRKVYARFAQAERALTHHLELLGKRGSEAKTNAEALRGEILQEEHEAAKRAFPPEVQAQITPVDLLAPALRDKWRAPTFEGFKLAWDGAAMRLQNSAPKSQGVVSFLQKEPWRDVVLEMEFTVEQVGLELALHVGAKVDNSALRPSFKTKENKGKLEAGKNYKAKVTVLGLDMKVEIDDQVVEAKVATAAQLREGLLSFVVPAGAAVKVNKLQARRLE
ncbi:MAG: hypothetical protein IT458_14520 [Planctomycetes bacterium]|nr:hypothetical protein [Planctomycetota bacterium]